MNQYTLPSPAFFKYVHAVIRFPTSVRSASSVLPSAPLGKFGTLPTALPPAIDAPEVLGVTLEPDIVGEEEGFEAGRKA